MKKHITIISLLIIALMLNGCSSDSDNTLRNQVIGKWQYTSFFTDVATDENGNPIDTNVLNGYVLDLKSNGTFTSNELPEYSGGTYTVISNPGKNLKLVYQNGTTTKTCYKQLITIATNALTVFYSNDTPYPDDLVAFEGQILTRVP